MGVERTEHEDVEVAVDDLGNLSPLSNQAVLQCLHHRYTDCQLYTRAGSTLIAVNPFQAYPNLYDAKAILHYAHQQQQQQPTTSSQSPTEPLPPHIYEIGEKAYGNLVGCDDAPCQSIIVSGESGAGKTVTASHLIKYLVTVANPDCQSGADIEQRILDCGPILQAFGNAATLRNNNSSRFGKYIQLHFDSGRVVGASVRTYLLEKTRVVYQQSGEDTFHVFYQSDVFQECSNKEEVCAKLFPHILNRDNEPDREQWTILQTALATFGLDSEKQQQVFQLLLGILHLRCLTFLEDEDFDDLCTIDPATTSLSVCCDLLGLTPATLESSLTHRRITASHRRRQSVFHKPCQIPEAQNRRDCLAKVIYARLFDWLVALINSSISCEESDRTIGILDIYGFESFEHNSLEQLCINYANEKLQQHFVGYFLRDLQEEYEREAIPWTFTEFVDNRPCLDLLEGAQGVFATLNEECLLKRACTSENELALRLVRSCGGNNNKVVQQDAAAQTFTVHHYAAPVHYTIRDLVEKNKDHVAEELVELLERSNNPLVSKLFPSCSSSSETPGAKKKTLLAKFKQSVDLLMTTLYSSQPHYIRCIKPNPDSEPSCFVPGYVLPQLQACGVAETVAISRKGYPVRMSYVEFRHRYSVILGHSTSRKASASEVVLEERLTSLLVGDEAPRDIHKQLLTPTRKSSTPKRTLRRRTGISSGDHDRKVCASILHDALGPLSTPSSLCSQFGRTKLFLKEQQVEMVELAKAKILDKCAATIQRQWHKYRLQQAACVIIQKGCFSRQLLQNTITDLLSANYVHRLFRAQWVVNGGNIPRSPNIHHSHPLSSTQAMHVDGNRKDKTSTRGWRARKHYKQLQADAKIKASQIKVPPKTLPKPSKRQPRTVNNNNDEEDCDDVSVLSISIDEGERVDSGVSYDGDAWRVMEAQAVGVQRFQLCGSYYGRILQPTFTMGIMRSCALQPKGNVSLFSNTMKNDYTAYGRAENVDLVANAVCDAYPLNIAMA